MIILVAFGASNGLDSCPEGAWGELLRKDGDPVYEDKGIIEKGAILTAYNDILVTRYKCQLDQVST